MTFRGVASADGTTFYTSGAAGSVVNPTGGLRYVASLGATSSTGVGASVFDNLRQVNAIDGDLYLAAGAGTPGHAVYKVGAGGFPTSGPQSYNALTPLSPPLLEQYNSFVLADLDPTVAGFDTLYAVDSSSGGKGLEKWSLVGGTWTLKNFITIGGNNGSTFGLTGYTQGDSVTLFLTTTSAGTGPSNLYSMVDTAGYNLNNNGSFSLLVSA